MEDMGAHTKRGSPMEVLGVQRFFKNRDCLFSMLVDASELLEMVRHCIGGGSMARGSQLDMGCSGPMGGSMEARVD